MRLFFRLIVFGLGIFALTVPLAQAQMGGGGGMGRGMASMMMLSGASSYRSDNTLLRMEDAITIAQTYMINRNSSNLALDEIEEWEYNYYVVVKEASPSQYKAYQLVIDKWTGYVMPEPGPNLMWNWKYCGMMGMGGMCGNKGNVNFTATQATVAANQFLKQRFGRYRAMVVAGPPDLFYGYYNFDVKEVKTGIKSGMLSVNMTTGQVWYHTWHGRFITGREL
jgi:hypothetical protein